DLKYDHRSGSKLGDLNGIERQRTRTGRPHVLVIAQGTNNALVGGWGLKDDMALQQLLDMIHPSTCVVMVLGGYGPGLAVKQRQAIDYARTQIISRASTRPGT